MLFPMEVDVVNEYAKNLKIEGDLCSIAYSAVVMVMYKFFSQVVRLLSSILLDASLGHPLAARKGRYIYIGSFFSTGYAIVLILFYLLEACLVAVIFQHIDKDEDITLMYIVWSACFGQAVGSAFVNLLGWK